MRWLRLHSKRLLDKQHSLAQKSKCRRAACSKTRPILTWETNCLHDLWAFPCNRSLWRRTRTLRLVHKKDYRMTTSKISTLYKSKLQDSVQHQTVLALYDLETVRSNGQTSYLRLKTSVKLHTDQTMRTRNFRVRRELWKEDQSPRINKERNPTLRGKWKSVFSGMHMDNVPKESHAVSVMTKLPLATVAKVRDWKDDRLLPHQIRRKRLTVRKAREMKALTKEVRFCAEKIVKKRHVNFDIFPCVRITSQNPDAQMAIDADFDMLRQRKSPAKSQRKVVRKDQFHYRGSLYNWVVYLKILIRENLFHANKENWDWNTLSSSPKAPGTKWKFGKRKGPSRGIIPKVSNSWAWSLRAKFEERSHEETLHQEGCARSAAWDLAKNIYKLKNSNKATFYTPFEVKAMQAPSSKRPEERQFVVDSRASSMHMMSTKRVELRWIGHFAKVQEPHCGTCSQRWSAHPRGGTSVRSRSKSIRDCAITRGNTSSPIVGKLCEDHGYSCEWVSGEKPRLTKDGKTIKCKTDNFVPLVVPGSATSSGSDSSSTSPPQDSSSSSSSPALE